MNPGALISQLALRATGKTKAIINYEIEQVVLGQIRFGVDTRFRWMPGCDLLRI